MQITWTNCAEQMPPDDSTEIIIHGFGYYTRHEGSDIKRWMITDHILKWTEFTEEKWEYLDND